MLHYPEAKDAWLELRKKYVSSTESATLFGSSPYSTAYEIAVAKKDGIELDFEGGERSELGLAFQRSIADVFAARNGLKIRALNAYAAQEPDCMGASFDFEIVGAEGDGPLAAMYRERGPGVLEIKNVDAWIYKQQWVDDEAPAHIEIQVQHQLHCIQREWAAIAVAVGGNRIVHLVRPYDAAVGVKLAKKCTKFMTDLGHGIYPPVTLPQDAEIICKIYGYADPGNVLDAQADESIGALCAAYGQAAKDEKAAKETKDSAKAMLLQKIGTADKVLAAGYTISCGMVAGTHIEYDREPYRNFRITPKAAKKEKSK